MNRFILAEFMVVRLFFFFFGAHENEIFWQLGPNMIPGHVAIECSNTTNRPYRCRRELTEDSSVIQ